MKLEEYHRQFTIYCSAAVIGAELIFLQAFLSMGALDLFSIVALYCFGSTLPILAGGLVYHWSRDRLRPGTPPPRWMTFLHTLAMVVAFLGLNAALLHLSVLVGGLFFGSASLSWLVHSQSIERHLEEQKQRKQKQLPQTLPPQSS